MEYKMQGTCAKKVEFDIIDNRIYNVKFTRGCNGNLQGISKLVEGKPVDEVIEKLSGIRCGAKKTSCPDQLATALKTLNHK